MDKNDFFAAYGIVEHGEDVVPAKPGPPKKDIFKTLEYVARTSQSFRVTSNDAAVIMAEVERLRKQVAVDAKVKIDNAKRIYELERLLKPMEALKAAIAEMLKNNY